MLPSSLLQRLASWCPWLLRDEPKQPVKVLVTGAAGQIGYAIVAMIARGLMLGPDQPVVLHMLDLPKSADALSGVRMELIDAALPLLRGVVATSDEAEAFRGVSFAVLIGGWPRKEGMHRKDLIAKNVSIYQSQASALQQHAAPNCKVLVVANPANTNALVLKELAPVVPAKNITYLTRLDHNRALGQISEKLGVHVGHVRNAIVWGNHSSTQFPDVSHAIARTQHGEKPVRELIADEKWFKEEFVSVVQQRGEAVIKARKQSSSLSAASAACDHMRDWILGTPKGTWVSMGVCSDGSYGVPKGIFYSFPVTCEKGEWSIVQGEFLSLYQIGSDNSTTVLDMICLLFEVLRLMTSHNPRWSFRRMNSMKRGPWRMSSSSALKAISRSLVYT
ncbi:Malate dehydrogenase, cytoplasmic [Zea mays]|uniref:Malate dehydrogenase n=1 Tax=Zea mays TaxID=4577 RepID=A0A3L6G3E6_MAIZE|nr:Malate dehydrogenase, cytoplasmic [Zea mays]